MSRLAILGLLVVTAFPEVAAQPHLVPEKGAIAGTSPYETVLIELFGLDVPSRDILIQVLLLPSFEHEGLAGVRRTESGYEAFSIVPTTSVWFVGFGEDMSGWDAEAARQVELLMEGRPVESQTARLMHEAWERTILETRYPHHPRQVRDGVSAHFSAWVTDRGIISGRTHSPPAGSQAAGILELGQLLGKYARREGIHDTDLRVAVESMRPVRAE
jgi:hypothetical protein